MTARTEQPGFDPDASWSSTLDAEIQRDLLSVKVFGGTPPTIGRFVVEKLLGAGASAAVYATRDPVLDRRVAIKVLARPRDGRLAEASARVIREARALAHLSHRNVVSIYEVGQWEDRPFIAMELIEGKTLARWIADRPRQASELLDAFLQAGRGLAAAHAQGHVHRDFKPANVLVADDGRVVVSDFGLASDAASEDASADRTSGAEAPLPRPVGTPAYAAPEQRTGAAARPAADVYSFALSLIEALLGHHPMPQTSAAWRSELRPLVPRRLYRALCAAAELDPQRRTPSLSPLLEALSAYSPARRRARRRVLAIAAAALALGLVLAIAAAAWLWRVEKLQRRTEWQRRPGTPPTDLPNGLSAERSLAAAARPTLVEPLAPRPAELAENLAALLETPPAARDERWRGAARSMLLMPVPAQIPCRWPEQLRSQAIIGDQVVALDWLGGVSSCDLATAAVTPLAKGVRCLRPDPRGAVALVKKGAIELWHRDGGRWASEPGGPAPADDDGPAGLDDDGYCAFELAPPATAPGQPPAPDRPRPPRELSPSGRYELLAGEGGALQAVEPLAGRRFPLADAQVRRARFIDDDHVVAVDEVGKVWRWSLAQQRAFVIADHPGTGALWGLALSPGGGVLASSSSGRQDGVVRLSSVDGAAQRQLHVTPGAGVHALLFSGDRLMAGSNDGVLHIWKWPGLEVLAERSLPGKAWVWSLALARPRGAVPIEVIGMGRITRDGVQGGSQVLLAQGGAARPVFTGGASGNTGIDDLAISPDGRLAAASTSAGELALISLPSGKVKAVTAHTGESRRVRFLDGGRQVITIGDDSALRIWSPSGEPVAELPIGHGQLYDLELIGTSALIGTSDGHLMLWDLAARRLLRSYQGHSVGISVARIDGTARWILSADLSGRLCVRRLEREECHTSLLGHTPGKAIRNARFLADGRLATSSDDNTVRMWSPPYQLDDDELACELSRRAFAPAPACTADAARAYRGP